jgi:hypothetical protein
MSAVQVLKATPRAQPIWDALLDTMAADTTCFPEEDLLEEMMGELSIFVTDQAIGKNVQSTLVITPMHVARICQVACTYMRYGEKEEEREEVVEADDGDDEESPIGMVCGYLIECIDSCFTRFSTAITPVVVAELGKQILAVIEDRKGSKFCRDLTVDMLCLAVSFAQHYVDAPDVNQLLADVAEVCEQIISKKGEGMKVLHSAVFFLGEYASLDHVKGTAAATKYHDLILKLLRKTKWKASGPELGTRDNFIAALLKIANVNESGKASLSTLEEMLGELPLLHDKAEQRTVSTVLVKALTSEPPAWWTSVDTVAEAAISALLRSIAASANTPSAGGDEDVEMEADGEDEEESASDNSSMDSDDSDDDSEDSDPTLVATAELSAFGALMSAAAAPAGKYSAAVASAMRRLSPGDAKVVIARVAEAVDLDALASKVEKTTLE